MRRTAETQRTGPPRTRAHRPCAYVGAPGERAGRTPGPAVGPGRRTASLSVATIRIRGRSRLCNRPRRASAGRETAPSPRWCGGHACEEAVLAVADVDRKEQQYAAPAGAGFAAARMGGTPAARSRSAGARRRARPPPRTTSFSAARLCCSYSVRRRLAFPVAFWAASMASPSDAPTATGRRRAPQQREPEQAAHAITPASRCPAGRRRRLWCRRSGTTRPTGLLPAVRRSR